MKRIWLGFDEFFKLGMKVFFEAFKFKVQTEFEVLKLPKRLDVLVVKLKEQKIPSEFHVLRYFKEHNLISFKSPRDRIKEKDFNNAIIYLHGYINLTSDAIYSNTTMTILCNHTPTKYLQKCKQNISEMGNGIWMIKYGIFNIYLVNLNLIGLQGLDDGFLKNFAETESFSKSISFQQKSRTSKEILDIVHYFMYIRNRSFEKTKFKEIKMPVAMKGDITEIVEPYFQKGLEYGKIETAKKMKKKGLSNKMISEITGLSMRDLKKLDII